MTVYRVRYGNDRKRITKGNPKKQARKERALVRQAEEEKRPANDPRRKQVRLSKVK